MKKHKLFAVFAAAVMALVFAGCQTEPDNHSHSFSKDWTCDKTSHWHAATCEHTDQVSEKADHSFGEWNTTLEPTEEAEGKKMRTCNVCSYKEEQTVAKLSHTHKFSEEWITDETYHWHAATCEHTEEVSEKAVHTFGEWQVIVEPTVVSEGKQERTCTVCSYKDNQAIAKLEGDFVEVVGGTISGKANVNNYEGVFIEGRTVTLNNFYMSKYEVTKAQYKKVMEDTTLNTLGITSDPSYTTRYSELSVADGEKDSERPVENVNWYDAVYFCNLLSQKDGLELVYTIDNPQTATNGTITHISSATVTADHTKNGYRLPTEAEWEYVARGGNPLKADWDYIFSGSDTADGTAFDADQNTGLDSVGWYKSNTSNGTHEKGLKTANALGIYDMSGNVCEWCYDWYSSSVTTGKETNPMGISSGSSRAFRGGCWNIKACWNASCYRTCVNPDYSDGMFGFRLVRSAN